MKPKLFRLDNHLVQWLREHYVDDKEGGINPDPDPSSGRRVSVYSIEDKEVFEDIKEELEKYSKETKIKFNSIEEISVMKYEVTEGYGEHSDFSVFDDDPKRIRKLSLVVLLSPPEDYEGGRLVLIDGANRYAIPKEKGVGVIFPSWLPHEVTDVTAGTRLSLVCWATGNRWR